MCAAVLREAKCFVEGDTISTYIAELGNGMGNFLDHSCRWEFWHKLHQG